MEAKLTIAVLRCIYPSGDRGRFWIRNKALPRRKSSVAVRLAGGSNFEYVTVGMPDCYRE
jgi:hypothetical protein